MREGGDTAARDIKVVIADMPRLLAAVVRKAVEVERDMTIVAQVNSADALADAVAEPVDVIITAATGGELAAPYRAALFGQRPIPVVAISADGTSVDVYGRRMARGCGLDGLIGLIREAVGGSQLRFGS
jgi:DNA-binding NarL/FixJ family response regulator